MRTNEELEDKKQNCFVKEIDIQSTRYDKRKEM